jgi:hypothetical protein
MNTKNKKFTKKLGCKSFQNGFLATLRHTQEYNTKVLLKEDVNWCRTLMEAGSLISITQ